MTLSNLRSWLSTLADAHALVPASEVLERLPATTAEGLGVDGLAALDVHAAGEVLGRSASTVRDYCRRELLPGAYRQQGREWRIPVASVKAFQVEEAKPKQANVAAKRLVDDDLSSWRKEIQS